MAFRLPFRFKPDEDVLSGIECKDGFVRLLYSKRVKSMRNSYYNYDTIYNFSSDKLGLIEKVNPEWFP